MAARRAENGPAASTTRRVPIIPALVSTPTTRAPSVTIRDTVTPSRKVASLAFAKPYVTS